MGGGGEFVCRWKRILRFFKKNVEKVFDFQGKFGLRRIAWHKSQAMMKGFFLAPPPIQQPAPRHAKHGACFIKRRWLFFTCVKLECKKYFLHLFYTQKVVDIYMFM